MLMPASYNAIETVFAMFSCGGAAPADTLREANGIVNRNSKCNTETKTVDVSAESEVTHDASRDDERN